MRERATDNLGEPRSGWGYAAIGRRVTAVTAPLRPLDAHWLSLVALILLAASLLAFGLLAEAVVTEDSIVETDQRLWAWLRENGTSWLTAVIRVVTECGGPLVLVPVTVAAVVTLAERHRRADLALVLLAPVGAQVLLHTTKAVVGRERPSFPDPLVSEGGSSFPSGHAMTSLAIYGALAFIFARRRSSWTARLLLLGAAAALAAAIGFSRLYLGVHYLSDVLAGYAAGLAWLLLCILGVALYEARAAR